MTDIATYSADYFATGSERSDSFIAALTLKSYADKATSDHDISRLRNLRWATTGLDFSEIILQDVVFERGVLHRREPLVLRPVPSESGALYQLDIDELEISIAAYSREELVDALHDFLIVLWNEYALEDDANLTINACELKYRLLSDFCVVEQCT